MDFKKCEKCNGTGYIPEYKHVQDGICFSCNGKGILETKSRDSREKVNGYQFFEAEKIEYTDSKKKFQIKNDANIDLNDEKSMDKELKRSFDWEKEEREEVERVKYDQSYIHSFYSDDEYLEDE